jgi:hypothetical protein
MILTAGIHDKYFEDQNLSLTRRLGKRGRFSKVSLEWAHHSEDDLFPESEAYAVVQIVHQSGFEPVGLHLKAFYKGV